MTVSCFGSKYVSENQPRYPPPSPFVTAKPRRKSKAVLLLAQGRGGGESELQQTGKWDGLHSALPQCVCCHSHHSPLLSIVWICLHPLSSLCLCNKGWLDVPHGHCIVCCCSSVPGTSELPILHPQPSVNKSLLFSFSSRVVVVNLPAHSLSVT